MDEKIRNFVTKANGCGINIKHKNNIDVAFYATDADETHYCDPSFPHIKVSGYWINTSSKSPFIIQPDKINIKTEDLGNWIEIPDPRADNA